MRVYNLFSNFLRFFATIVAVFFISFSASHAEDCVLGTEGCEPEFTITTVRMPSNSAFSFRIAAKGTFYIDWGDGSGIDSCTVSQCQNGYRVDNGFCIENTININWDQGYGDGDNIISNTCSYDGEITMPEEPTRPGYTFTGWKILVK